MNLHSMRGNNIWRRFTRTMGITLTVAGLMLAAITANASCGSRSGTGPSPAASLAILANLTAAEGGHGNSIVGLWHVTFTMTDGTF